MCWLCNVWVCKCVICNVLLCVCVGFLYVCLCICVGFVMFLCVFAWVLSCAVVCLRGFFNVMC